MRDLELMQEEVLLLLRKHSSTQYSNDVMAPLIAKTSIKMGHLYSDLGLETRADMAVLMKKNFPSLAKLKPESIRWKKYLYDCIGKTAPACGACSDASDCFSCSLVS